MSAPIRRRKPRNPPWTAAEDALLIQRYADTSDKALVSMLPGRSEAAVCDRRSTLGLRRKGGSFTKEQQAKTVAQRREWTAGWPRVPSPEDVDRVFLTAIHREAVSLGIVPCSKH